jgi:hypothetical protein
MANNNNLQDLLDRRCRRSIAVILGVKEREVDKFLSPEVAAKLRKVIMDQLNEFSSLANDILDSATKDIVFNELYLEKLEAVHRDVKALKDT